jgi:hypothetical protein
LGPQAEDLNLNSNNIDNAAAIFLKERSAAQSDIDAQGQIWVKNDSPNSLWFTNDAGDDISLSTTWAGIDDGNFLRVDFEEGAEEGDYGRFTDGGIEPRTPVQVLEDLSGQADDPFDWNYQELRNVTLENDFETINFIIDGGGSAITTGVKGDVFVHFNGVLRSWVVQGDQSGSIVVDVWGKKFADESAPTDSDAMPGSGSEPTLSSETSALSTAPSWNNMTITGSPTVPFHLRYNVDSISTCERVTVALAVQRTL